MKRLLFAMTSFFIFTGVSYGQRSCGCGAGVHSGGAVVPGSIGQGLAAGSFSSVSHSGSEQMIPVYGAAQESVVDNDAPSEVHACPYGKCPCGIVNKAQTIVTSRPVIWVKESEYLSKQQSDSPYELYQGSEVGERSWTREGQRQNLDNIIVNGTKARASAIDLYEELVSVFGESKKEEIQSLLLALHSSRGNEEKTTRALNLYNNFIESVSSAEELSSAPQALYVMREYFQKLVG